MVEWMELWMPILAAAALVFVGSSVIHMVLGYHNGDYGELPNEDAVLEGMRSAGVGKGHYVFPYCMSMKDMGSPEMLAKYERGPVGFLTLYPNGPMPVGKSLLQWFVYSIFAGICVAYVARMTLSPDAEYMEVFRLTGTVAFLTYAGCSPTDSIWKGMRWSVTAKFLLDGVIYGALTGGAFGWLWPGA